MRLQDKVAVVTGGGGGIGRATALCMAREGAAVIVSDIDIASGEKTVRIIRESGGQATFAECHVAEPAEVEQLMEQAVNTYGGIDVLFNNAGIGNAELRLSELTVEEWDRVVDVNLKGVFLGMKYAIPHMVQRGGGSIINTSSVLGVKGKKYTGPYNASKAGVITLTKNAALEYGKHKIRVNAIAPGVIDTAIVDGWKAQEWKWEIISKANALKRVGRPEEVAQAVLFLASDEASYITASTLYVDGGGHTF
ncbi:MAG: glucose 1-dehydrogenase [Bacillaceae bacterium]|nr:glucose 1-dehydrogenase [Bacillaceae bacterium]